MVSDLQGPTIGEVVSLVRGNTYKSALLGRDGPMLLGLGTIQRNGGFRADSLKTYGGESAEKILLLPGDLYVSLKDVTQSADLLGAIARLPEAVFLGRLTQDTVKLDFTGTPYPRSLLYWALRAPQYRAFCRAHATGTTNLGLAREDFLGYRLPAPRSDTLSLVELLEGIETRIELLRQTNNALEAIAQALFNSWFVDFDPVRAKAEGRDPEGMDAATGALFPAGFSRSELGGVPSSWKIQSLGSVAGNFREQAKPELLDPETPYLGLEHMPRKSIALMDRGEAEGLASGKFWYSPCDILFGRLRPYFHKVGVAAERGICSTDILVVRPHEPEWFGYCICQFSSDALIAYATQVSNGARMPRVGWKDLAAYQVVTPPVEIAAAFDRLIRPMILRIHQNIEHAKTLGNVRDTFLPRLISGKIRVDEMQQATAEALG
ncbi:restriction endonuclease subunit S [Luteimonas sp. A277]